MVFVALFACSGGGDTATPLVGDPDNGAVVYANACAACHGASGEGGSGPAMTTVIPAFQDANLEAIIVDGVGEMPPIDLSDQELADVIAWLRATFG